MWPADHRHTDRHTDTPQPLLTFGVSSYSITLVVRCIECFGKKVKLKRDAPLYRHCSRKAAAMCKRRCRVLVEIVPVLFIRSAMLITRGATSCTSTCTFFFFFFWANCLNAPMHVLEFNVALMKLGLGVLLLPLRCRFRVPSTRGSLLRNTRDGSAS